MNYIRSNLRNRLTTDRAQFVIINLILAEDMQPAEATERLQLSLVGADGLGGDSLDGMF